MKNHYEHCLSYFFFLLLLKAEEEGALQQELEMVAEKITVVGKNDENLFLHVADVTVGELFRVKYEILLKSVIAEKTGTKLEIIYLNDEGRLRWKHAEAREHTKTYSSVLKTMQELLVDADNSTRVKLKKARICAEEGTKLLHQAATGHFSTQQAKVAKQYIRTVNKKVLPALNSMRVPTYEVAVKSRKVKAYLRRTTDLLDVLIILMKN